MATRLYPLTRNPKVLEALAGVPAGTSAATNQLREELNNNRDGYDGWQAALARAGEHATTLYNFQLFGWGRLNNPKAVAEAGLDPTVGSTQDEQLTARLLAHQGVTLPPGVTPQSLEGLAWN